MSAEEILEIFAEASFMGRRSRTRVIAEYGEPTRSIRTKEQVEFDLAQEAERARRAIEVAIASRTETERETQSPEIRRQKYNAYTRSRRQRERTLYRVTYVPCVDCGGHYVIRLDGATTHLGPCQPASP